MIIKCISLTESGLSDSLIRKLYMLFQIFTLSCLRLQILSLVFFNFQVMISKKGTNSTVRAGTLYHIRLLTLQLMTHCCLLIWQLAEDSLVENRAQESRERYAEQKFHPQMTHIRGIPTWGLYPQAGWHMRKYSEEKEVEEGDDWTEKGGQNAAWGIPIIQSHTLCAQSCYCNGELIATC